MDVVRLRGIARFVMIVWAGAWTLFAASDIGASGDTTETKLTALAFAAIVFAGSAAIAWHCEHVGASLLILEGVLACVAYPLGFYQLTGPSVYTVIAGLAVPPMLAGALLLSCWMHSRPHGTPPHGRHHAG